MAHSGSMHTRVVLVHGWGGSFHDTWVANGFAEVLADAGHEVIAVDLLGHGTAPRPHDPAAYHRLGDRVVEQLGDEPVAAVGFSLGGAVLLDLAASDPRLFDRLVVAGVADNALRRTDEDQSVRDAIATAVLAGPTTLTDPAYRLFVGYAHRPGNDPAALAACLRAGPPPLTTERLSHITVPVLVALGDRDAVGSPDPLVDALPDSRHVSLRGCDHFATTDHFGFWDEVLSFVA